MNDVEETTEQKLIRLCRKGDRVAQKALYDQLASKMFPVCIRYAGDRTVAEDLLQDGFVTLFSRLDSYKGEGSFEGWARRIFVNTALMYLRKKDALKMSDDLENARNLTSESTSQIQDVGYKELMKLVTSLPAGFRTVFNLYVIEGYTHKEIAERLGVSVQTVNYRIQQAVKLLAAELKDYLPLLLFLLKL